MNNNDLNIDKLTKELVDKAEISQPTSRFTQNVMSRILKDPAVKVSFVSQDDRKSNFWLAISLAVMFIGSFALYFLKNGFNLKNIGEDFKASLFVNYFTDFFAKLWNELSLSPYILLALIGVIILVVIDRTIVKYLYSI